ncbi:protein HIRA/HIR1 [Nematocida ausubeli]|nr:protein HIRA/HIR1 [Nematocida ausubeli]
MKVFLTSISHVLNKKKCPIFSIDIRPNSDGSLATGGQDGSVKIWKITQEESHEEGSFVKHGGAVLCVRFSPDGNLLASASDDGSVIIWGLMEKEGSTALYIKKRLNNHKSDVSSLAWSNKHLVTGGYDGSVIIYDRTTYNIVTRLEKHEKGCKGVEFSPDAEYISTYGDEGEVFIYDKSWKKVSSSKKPFKGTQTESFFGRMSWSPDGKYVACGLSFFEKQDAVSLLSAALARAYTLIGHTAPVETVAFNPWLWQVDETVSYVIATGSQDRSIAIWVSSAAKPLILLTEVSEQPILDLRWSSDGRSLYGCSYDGSVFVLSFGSDLGSQVAPTVERTKSLPYTKEFLQEPSKFPSPDGFPVKENKVVVEQEKRKIVPRLIKQLDGPDEFGAVHGHKVVLFMEIKKEETVAQDTPVARIETETKTSRYEITAKSDRTTIIIRKDSREWFTLEGHKISGIAADKSILVVAREGINKQMSTVWVYDLQKGVLLVPAMCFSEVVSLGVKNGLILVVSFGSFKVIDLSTGSALDGSILMHSAVVNVLLDETYFLVVLYEDGGVYYYNQDMHVWCALELNCASAYSNAYHEEACKTDSTFDHLENKCVVGVHRGDGALASTAIKQIIETAGRAVPCTPGIINRVDGIIEEVLGRCQDSVVDGVDPGYVVSLLVEHADTNEFQEYAHMKVQELKERELK